jgi:hypothetical protein
MLGVRAPLVGCCGLQSLEETHDFFGPADSGVMISGEMRHCEERNDEAIQCRLGSWMYGLLAMTIQQERIMPRWRREDINVPPYRHPA